MVTYFTGKAFEKTIVKAHGVRYLAKTFTLPDVQVGSIIEYRYKREWSNELIYDSRWILSSDLFTKHAKFSLKPYSNFSLRWSWHNLPPDAPKPVGDSYNVRLDISDLAAFQVEDYMPPQDELKARVNFVYSSDNNEKELEKFWKKEGKKHFDWMDSFTNKKKQMEQAVATLISPSDDPETKLHKIYARVQQVHNLS